MSSRIIQNSFNSGEISPSLHGRIDDAGYQSGVQTCKNFFVLPQGSLRTRGGFEYVTSLDTNQKCRLIPFRFASDQTLVLVLTGGRMRILTEGQEVLNEAGETYEITTPFAEDVLFDLEYSQNTDIVTVTAPEIPPYEIRRYGSTDWRIYAVSVAPQLSPPSSVSVSASYSSYMSDEDSKAKNRLTCTYVVTAINEDGQESIASKQVTGKGNYYIDGCSMYISWSAVSGASRYRVYRSVAGVFGYVGETENRYLSDIGNNPDMNTTPPKYLQPFDLSGGEIYQISISNAGAGYEFNPSYGFIWKTLTFTERPYVVFDSDTSTTREVKYTVYIYDGNSLKYTKEVDAVVETVTSAVDDTETSEVRYYLPSTVSVDYSDQLSNPNIRAYVTSYPSGLTMTVTVPEGYEELYNSEGYGISTTSFASAFTQDYTGATMTIPLTISGGSGTGASASAVITGGVVITVVVYSSGKGYSSPTATLNFSGTYTTKATFTAKATTINSSSSELNYPSCSTQFDQRRIFAGSYANPLRVWMTNAGQQEQMVYHIPSLSDDRIQITAVTQDADRIKHAIALESLMLLTGSSELRIYTQNSDALTPSSVAVRAQSYIGSSQVRPVIINNQALFCASRGNHLYAIGYNSDAGGYISSDVSIRAPHLFDNKTVVDMALSKAPFNVVYVVTDDGKLIMCTYLVEQSVIAWTQLETDGKVESVCCVSEGLEDRLYAVIKRSSGKYIERLSPVNIPTDSNKYRYLDCYLDETFDTAVNIVSGLDIYEGKTVAVYVDGKEQSQKVVKDGSITLDTAGKNIAVGLPYTAKLITLPLASASAQGGLQGRAMNVSEIFIRKLYDGKIQANGYPNDVLYDVTEVNEYDTNEAQIVQVSFDGQWDYNGQLEIEHSGLLPLEILAITGNSEFEGGRGT